MPVKKVATKPAAPVKTPVINTSKISSMTIGDVLGKASKFNANQAVYVLLLISFANGHFPVKGDENAKVTIVEFSDFECPFCGRFYTDTLPSLLKDYIDTGKVKLYYRHFPLAFHPQAKPLANVAECANEQDKFWEMHDKIFENNATVSSSTMDTFKGWAADLGLNTSKFNDCVDNSKYEKDIDADTADGTAAGVSGTPTFYINGLQLVGAQPIDAFKKIIDQELAK